MDGVKNLSCTHLLDLFRYMVRIKSHSGIVARDRIERDNRGIGTRNMPAVFDAAQHSGKVAILLNSQVGQTTRAAGDMKEGHHGRLEIVRRWIQLDGTRLEKLRVEHLKNIESVGLVERSWTMGGNAGIDEVPTDASLYNSDRERL
jgi:hypothetical protein